MKKKPTWFIVNRFFAPKKGRIITRKELMAFRKKMGLGSSVENYRLYLTRAGFLKHIGPGKYKVVRTIPADLATTTLYAMAYPPKKDRDLGSICLECARERRWKMPKDHCCTVSYTSCPYCKRDGVPTAGTNDFIKAGETRLNPLTWD